MATSQLAPIYDDLIDFMIEKATPKEILEFEPSPEAQARAVYLLEQNSAGKLTSQEALELE